MYPMDKTRLEAFNDIVFAIVITLLVLDVSLPIHTTVNNLSNNLVHIVPSLATYALSVFVVGIY